MGDAGTLSVLAQDTLTGAGVQTITGAKTFLDTTFKQRNPANTQTLTWAHPAITASQNHYMHQPYMFILFKLGSTYYCQNGITGGVELSGAEPGPVFHYALVNAAGLGKILIKAGTYTFDVVGSGSKPAQILTLYDNTCMEGEGMYNTILVSTSNTAAKNFFTNDDPTNGNSKIILNNFKIDHTLSSNMNTVGLSPIKDIRITKMYLKNGASAHFNFYVSGRRDAGGIPDMWVDNCYIDGCLFESNTSSSWDNFAGGLIRNSAISNCTFGPSGGSAGFAQRLIYYTTVSNCVAHTSSSSGFNLESGQNNTFTGCIAHDCATTGFKNLHISTGGPPVDGFPIAMHYIGCQAWNNTRGFNLQGHYNVVTGCKAYQNSAHGIDMDSGDYNQIVGNQVYNNGTNTGLSASFRSGIKLGYTAITGYTYAGKNVVSGNYCFDSQGTATQTYGISEGAATVNNNYIHNNTCWGNTTSPILKSGANTVAALNYLTTKYTQTSPLTFSDYQELTAISAPSSPATGFIRYYPKTIDANNDALYYKTRLNGAVIEVKV